MQRLQALALSAKSKREKYEENPKYVEASCEES